MSTNRCISYEINNISDNIITLDNGVILNFEYLPFPLPMSNIQDFEMKNSNISVNAFGLKDDNDIVGPYHSIINEKAKHVNLLLLEDGWIKIFQSKSI